MTATLDKSVEQWVPADSGLTVQVDIPLMAVGVGLGYSAPEPVLLGIGDNYEKSGDLWLPPKPAPSYDEMLSIATIPTLNEITIGGMQGFADVLAEATANLLIGAKNLGLASTSWTDEPAADVVLAELIPSLDDEVELPCEHHRRDLSDAIVHLNDSHKWSRERIADWLDSLDVDLRFQPASSGN